MQNRYVGDIGDYLKLSILRALSPGHRLGVAWWLHPDEDHNRDGHHIGYLSKPEQWRRFDPLLFDALATTVGTNQRHVRALEAADMLPGAVFATDVIPTTGPITKRRVARQEWFAWVRQKVAGCDLVFVDPDNGLEPDGYSHRSAKAGKSVLLRELRGLSEPGRSLIVYHHQTRRAGGHHAETEHWAGRLRTNGFTTVDALRAKPYSPRVYFLLNASPDVRQRAEQLAADWKGFITWHPNAEAASGSSSRVASPDFPVASPDKSLEADTPSPPQRRRPLTRGKSTQPGYVNRNGHEVIRPTGIPGSDHGQYVYVLRRRTCGHEYGANGTDIWLRRCPSHDRGAAGLPIGRCGASTEGVG